MEYLSNMVRKNVTLTLPLSDARNVFYHLRDTPCYIDKRSPSVNKAKDKLGRQIGKADVILNKLQAEAGTFSRHVSSVGILSPKT